MRDLLFKDSVKQKSFAVSSSRRGVKEALLDYHVLQDAVLNGSPAALVRVTLHTGRFHQIRCQVQPRAAIRCSATANTAAASAAARRRCGAAASPFSIPRRTRPSSLRLRRRASFRGTAFHGAESTTRDGTRRLSFLHGMPDDLGERLQPRFAVRRTTVSGVTATVFTARGSPPALPGGRKFPAALRHRGSPSSTPQLSMTCPGK